MVTTGHGSSVLWGVDGRRECARYIARQFVSNRSDDRLPEFRLLTGCHAGQSRKFTGRLGILSLVGVRRNIGLSMGTENDGYGKDVVIVEKDLTRMPVHSRPRGNTAKDSPLRAKFAGRHEAPRRTRLTIDVTPFQSPNR